MTFVTTQPPATRNNIPRCDNCKNYMPRLITLDALRFCCGDCCQEWAAKQMAGTTAHEAFHILNRLRDYLKAKLNGCGEQAALVRLCMDSMNLYKDLPLEQLCDNATCIAVMAEEENTVDPELDFPYGESST